MKYLLILATLLFSTSSYSDWFKLNFNTKSNDKEKLCLRLSKGQTPQNSLADYLGKGNFALTGEYMFADKSQMLTFTSKTPSSFTFTNSFEKCLDLRAAINKSSKTVVYISGLCETPKYTGTTELEIAASIENWGSDRIILLSPVSTDPGPKTAIIKFVDDNGEGIPLFISESKEDCIKSSKRGAKGVRAADNSITSIANTLNQRDKEVQSKENTEKATRELILAAKARLEREYIDASWDIFNELKRQGIRFKTDLALPSNPMCSSKVVDSRSGGEFIVFHAHCDGVYVKFWPAGAKNYVSLFAQIIYGKRTMEDIKFDNNCLITIDLLENKTYTCPDLMKAEMPSIVRRDVRELIAKKLSRP